MQHPVAKVLHTSLAVAAVNMGGRNPIFVPQPVTGYCHDPFNFGLMQTDEVVGRHYEHVVMIPLLQAIGCGIGCGPVRDHWAREVGR